MAYCTRDITREVLTKLPSVPRPEPGAVLQVRMGKIKTLVNEPSGIYKTELNGPVFVGPTGVAGDEHVYYTHGGIERAIMQYDSGHYADWRQEDSPKPELFQFGGFGENIVGTSLTEENVCVGDVYQVGAQVLLEVSEPRNPCYKINLRFEWERALKRVTRTGRVGWLLRVKRTGYIRAGDTVTLLERPYPMWSCLNVKRVLQAKLVPLLLIQQLTEVAPLTEVVRDYAFNRLEKTPKRYTLIESHNVTARVKQLTFKLSEPVTLQRPEFPKFSFAQIRFGNNKFARSYSIISGDMNTFSLGVALDDRSRGGSAYLHQQLKVNDEIIMSPGGNPKAIEDEDRCIREDVVERRLVIIGGIGVTAFLPIVRAWEAQGIQYEVHYGVRRPEDAVFSNCLTFEKTTIYPASEDERLNVNELVKAPEQGHFVTRIYCCGPPALMCAVMDRATGLGYPDHLLHFESFGSAADGSRGQSFHVDVSDVESSRKASLEVPAEKSLLETLREAGFDIASLCEVGGCGACKVTLCSGKVQHHGTALYDSEKSRAMLSCVSRGVGHIKIELD